MLIGLVKWYNFEKGFGVIGTPEDEDYFLHISNFIEKIPFDLARGTAIVFLESIDKKKNRKTATNCHLVGEVEDWEIIYNYLGKSDGVKIEVDVRGQRYRGNSYQSKEIQSFSLVKLATEQFCRDKSDSEITKIITDYFDCNLKDIDFISYCKHIEFRISEDFSPLTSQSILENVFTHFQKGLNEEILFQVWKQKKFKYIAYTEKDDYEIPQNVLLSNIQHIENTELKRITNYSYGTDFCTHYIDQKFKMIENFTKSELVNLYQLLDFESSKNKEKRKVVLDRFLSQRVEPEIREQANNFGILDNNLDLNRYNRLIQLIPSQLNDEDKNRLKDLLYETVSRNCADEFKVDLWLNGFAREVPFESISGSFIDINTQKEKRISILTRLPVDKQFEMLKLYFTEYDFVKGFTLIEGIVKKEESLNYNFNLSEVLFNGDFWQDKKSSELINLINEYVKNEEIEDQKYELFLKGYVQEVPRKLVLKNIHLLTKIDCRKIFRSLHEEKTFIKEVLERKALAGNASDLFWLYDFATELLDKDDFDVFDKRVFTTFNQSDYFKIWEVGKGKIFPQNLIYEILNHEYANYNQINSWIEKNAVTIRQISDFLLSYLSDQIPVTDRNTFYRQLNHIKCLLQLDESNLLKIKQFQNNFYNVILWFLDVDEVFNFEQIKQKFIYFAPDEQVRIIRKLFFLKANGDFDLTIDKLDEITRFDLDLYKTNLKFNPEIPIDISTDIVIKALISFKNNKRFFVESEMLTIVLNDLKLKKTNRFRLSNYFENCIGRQTAEFNWKSNGTISKVKYGENNYYFAITFEFKEELVEAVKLLPGRKWNPVELIWGVPSRYEKEVLTFAKEHRFFLDFDGSNYANNIHLAEFKREDVPNGISYCEGRLANKPHEMFNQEFWWCAGKPCFSKCETIHSKEDWEKYTLLDFCEILGFNTDETNKMGDYIPKGHYYQFIALVNRFNRLLDKLYCRNCNHILYPSDFGTGHFAAHTVVRFQCRNENCSNNDEVYLNHCLNGQCNNIIDSRVSKRCENGLFICDDCGSCCSHNMLERRLANLKLTGGFIHDNLRRCVNEKLGHLERAEYFCYKCGAEMSEISKDVFKCSNCDVRYDTTTYRFKRPHIHLKNNRSILGDNSGSSTDNNIDFLS